MKTPRTAHHRCQLPRRIQVLRLGRLAMALLLAWLGLSSIPAAGAPRTSWLGEHFALDISGVTGWRASWADDRNPGFQILSGGGEVNVGLEFDSGFGFLLGGRALFGPNLGASSGDVYADATGQLMGQVRIADVRIALGAQVGRLFRCCGSELDTPQTSTILAGGFARVGFDWLSRSAALVRALAFWLRLGIDAHPYAGSDSLLPTTSMNLTISLGLRL